MCTLTPKEKAGMFASTPQEKFYKFYDHLNKAISGDVFSGLNHLVIREESGPPLGWTGSGPPGHKLMEDSVSWIDGSGPDRFDVVFKDMWTAGPWNKGECTTYGNVLLNGNAEVPAFRTAKADFVENNHEKLKQTLQDMIARMEAQDGSMTSDVVNEQLALVNKLLSEFENEVQPALGMVSRDRDGPVSDSLPVWRVAFLPIGVVLLVGSVIMLSFCGAAACRADADDDSEDDDDTDDGAEEHVYAVPPQQKSQVTSSV
jgi:hypothetical protein